MRRRLIHNLKSSNDKRRELRRNLTAAEAMLWTMLKNSQLDHRKFRRQHSIGPYIVDFYCAELRFAIELDGAGHMTLWGDEKDARRTEFLKRFNIRLVRFENRLIRENPEGVLEAIGHALMDDTL